LRHAQQTLQQQFSLRANDYFAPLRCANGVYFGVTANSSSTESMCTDLIESASKDAAGKHDPGK
jgi:hypothetical protein